MWVPIILAALSGALLTAAFPKPDLGWVAWVALVPLLWAVRGKGLREAFRLGWLCGLVHYATALAWIRYVVGHYGGLALPLALAVLLLLAAYLAVYPAVFALLAARWEGRPWLRVWGLPAAWVALELIRAHALSGFPWANLGYTQTEFTRLMQTADIAGVSWAGFLVVLGNTSLLALLAPGRARLSILGFAALLGLSVLYGGSRMGEIAALQEKAAPFTVAVAQGNVEQARKWDPAFQKETLERYRRLTLEAAAKHPRPDLVVWPETAVPFFFGLDHDLSAEVRAIVREGGVPVLFGSPAVELVEGRPRFLNRAYLLDGAGKTLAKYDKQHLVPFGEYVPFPRVLFFVRRLVEAAGDFAAGKDWRPLTLGDQRLGVLICYEAIFPELSRRTTRKGATLLVNITNDAWFGPSAAPYQHLQMARWRAVESRAPLVRAANTGISAVFDARGLPCVSLPLDTLGTASCTIRPLAVKTLYERLSEWFALTCMGATLASIIFTILVPAARRPGDEAPPQRSTS